MRIMTFYIAAVLTSCVTRHVGHAQTSTTVPESPLRISKTEVAELIVGGHRNEEISDLLNLDIFNVRQGAVLVRAHNGSGYLYASQEDLLQLVHVTEATPVVDIFDGLIVNPNAFIAALDNHVTALRRTVGDDLPVTLEGVRRLDLILASNKVRKNLVLPENFRNLVAYIGSVCVTASVETSLEFVESRSDSYIPKIKLMTGISVNLFADVYKEIIESENPRLSPILEGYLHTDDRFDPPR